MFFWKPDSNFYSSWVPDPHFTLLPEQSGGRQEVRYDLNKVYEFVYPDAGSEPVYDNPLTALMWSDIRARHKRVMDWVLQEAWPDINEAWFKLHAEGSSGTTDSRGRIHYRKTGETGST